VFTLGKVESEVPVVSVVLPTFRRPAALELALNGLGRQHSVGVSWEVIVVDNDEASGSRSIVETHTPSFPVPLRYISERARGACNARNAGIAAARGRVIAFCDDDVVPQPEWLSHLVQPVIDGQWDGAAGRVDLAWEAPRPKWLDDSLTSYLSAYSPHDASQDLHAEDFLLTANAAFRTDLLRRIGGMDPVLGPRSGVPMVNDDVDLYRRFRAAGGQVGYIPGAVVVHELPAHRLRRSYLIRRLYAQGRSDFRLERAYFLASTTRGLKSALQELMRALRARARMSNLNAPGAFLLLCDLARFAGFVAESLASLSPSWPGRRPSPARPLGDSES
jgi:glycosyltransferase involved in cell wall biosynthesis